MYFLKFAKTFREVSGDTWENDKLVLLRSLKGSANMWARETVITVTSFEEFERAYRRKYWSRLVHRQYKNEILGGENFIPGRTDLVTYVLRYYETNLYLDRPLDMREFLNEVAKHLPRSLEIILATTKEISCKEIFLRRIADISEDNRREHNYGGQKRDHPHNENYRRFDPNAGERYNRSYNNRRFNFKTDQKIDRH